MATGTTEPIEWWTATRRVALVVSILKGETPIADAARTYGLTVAEVEDWREKFLVGPRTRCARGRRTKTL